MIRSVDLPTDLITGSQDGGGRGLAGGPGAVGLVALVALLAVVGLRLAAHDGDPSIFVLAGDGVTDPAAAPGNLHVEPGIRGYDGQAFYRFARDPLTRDRVADGIPLLRPAYRHQRIGYPLLAWAASGGGRESAVPTALVAVNVLAGAALAAVAAALARDAGRSPWWGLVPAGWAGFLVALSLDLSEVLAAALLLGALLALRRSRWAPATALLVAAALTRETTLLVPLALLAAALLARLPLRTGDQISRQEAGSDRQLERGVPVVVGVVPLVAYGAWRLALRGWWGPTPAAAGDVDAAVGVPFVGLARRLGDLGALDGTGLLQLALALAGVALAATALGDRGAGRPHERLALAGALVLVAATTKWDLDVTFLRWTGDAVALGWLVALDAGTARLRRLAVVTAPLWAITALAWIPAP